MYSSKTVNDFTYSLVYKTKIKNPYVHTQTVPFFKIIWQQPSSHLITSAVAQWIECQPYDWSVVSLNPNKNYCCFTEQEICHSIPSLLSTGWFQEGI